MAAPAARPLFSARRWAWIRHGEPLACPAGHRLRSNAVAMGPLGLICQENTRGVQCGARALVVPAGAGTFVFEVTPGEHLHCRDHCDGDLAAIMRYLQVTTPSDGGGR